MAVTGLVIVSIVVTNKIRVLFNTHGTRPRANSRRYSDVERQFAANVDGAEDESGTNFPGTPPILGLGAAADVHSLLTCTCSICARQRTWYGSLSDVIEEVSPVVWGCGDNSFKLILIDHGIQEE